ncbi:hypothetical protein WJX84_009428, partial [Apatococcus fuscideae]
MQRTMLCKARALLVIRRFVSSLAAPAFLTSAQPRTSPSRLSHRNSRQWRSFQTSAVKNASGEVKSKSVYQCKECGETHLQYTGRCSSCKAWNSIQRVTVNEGGGGGGGGGAQAALAVAAGIDTRKTNASYFQPKVSGQAAAARSARTGAWVQGGDRPERLSSIGTQNFASQWRLPLHGPGGAEVAHVLGGGVVPGSMVLIGGDPGVGKSTLLLQVAGMLSQPDVPGQDQAAADAPSSDAEDDEILGGVLYVSGEESKEQVGSRAARMGLKARSDIALYSATRMEDILRAIVTMRPIAAIVDSIQTVYLDGVTGSAGSVSQVRECATALLHVAKRERVPIFLVGHVTKTGDIAGPRVLEHIVDTVLYMEGERHQNFRLLRGIKNRYGATDEVGVFQMDDQGLHAVPNPSALFLSDRMNTPGVSAAVTVTMEGTRPLLAEIQALCSPARIGGEGGGNQGPAGRYPNGVNRDRFSLLTAVLQKHAKLRLYTVDIHTNVVGGLAVKEPASDLAIAVAIASSYYESPVPPTIAVIGEIGLGGEIRP